MKLRPVHIIAGAFFVSGLVVPTWITIATGVRLQKAEVRILALENNDTSIEANQERHKRILFLMADAIDALQNCELKRQLLPKLTPGSTRPGIQPEELQLHHERKPMSKPSTDTATERQVANFRETNVMPVRITNRFLALLKKTELAALTKRLKLALENHELPETGGRARRRRHWAQLERVQSARRQRGYLN